MSECKVPQFGKNLTKLLADGVKPDVAMNIVDTQIEVFFASMPGDLNMEALFSDAQYVMSESEIEERLALEDEIKRLATPEFFANLAADGSIADAFHQLLGPQVATRFIQLLLYSGIDLHGEGAQRRTIITTLKEAISIQENLGNTESVVELKSSLEKEEAKLKRRQENPDNRAATEHSLRAKNNVLESFANIIHNLNSFRLVQYNAALKPQFEELEKEYKALDERTKWYNNKLDDYKNAYKTARTKEEKDKSRIAKDRFIADNKAEYKDNIKKLVVVADKYKALVKQAEEAQANASGSSDADRDKRNRASEELDHMLEQAKQNLTKSTTELALRRIVTATRNAARDASLSLMQHQNTDRVVATAVSTRMAAIDKNFSKEDTTGELETEAPIQIARQFFGETAISSILKNRPLIKGPTGDEIQDLSPLNRKETIKALSIFKSELTKVLNEEAFTDDTAMLTEGTLDVIRSLMNGTGVVDATSMNALNNTAGPVNTASEVAAESNPGNVPDENKVASHKEAVHLFESSLRRLHTVFGFPGFDGLIDEKTLIQILHPKLNDIGAAAWASALGAFSEKRQVGNVLAEDRKAFRQSLISSHGGDPSIMPEFSNPEWHTDNSKLITFGVEGFEDRNNPSSKLKSVRLIRIFTTDTTTGISKVEVLVNHRGYLVDASTVDARFRAPLTPAHITSVMERLEKAQNDGFKVITHGGNNSHFANLTDHMKDTDLLARVALRSIDLAANIASQSEGVSWQEKSEPGGHSLEDAVAVNIPYIQGKHHVTSDGRVHFIRGNAVDTTDNNKHIFLHPNKGIQILWEEAEANVDWYKVDAFAANSARNIANLYLQRVNDAMNNQNKFILRDQNTGFETKVEMALPVSNLLLNNTNQSNDVLMSDSMGALAHKFPQVGRLIGNLTHSYVIGYDASKIFNIIYGWALSAKASQALEVDGESTLSIQQGLETRSTKETANIQDKLEVATECAAGIQSILKEKFNELGYPLSINFSYQANGNSGVVTISDLRNGALPTAEFNEKAMYANSTLDSTEYENAIMDSFLTFIRKEGIRGRFNRSALDVFGKVERLEGEKEDVYWKRLLSEYLKADLPAFTSLSQFGNGELDWAPADRVGIALAHLIMNQKEGTVRVLNPVANGSTPADIAKAQEKALHSNQRLGIPNHPGTSDNVNRVQPYTLVAEEKSFEGFKVLNRIQFYLNMELTDENRAAMEAFLAQRMEQDPSEAISPEAKETVLMVSPPVRDLHPFSKVRNLDESRRLVAEHLHEIPRLLASFNHDCIYLGVSTPPRFLDSGLPVYYLSDFIHSGSPTASTLIGGGIHQLAWMMNYNLSSPAELAALDAALLRGIELVRKYGDKAFNYSNKTDDKYSGMHIILMLLECKKTGTTDMMQGVLDLLGARVDFSTEKETDVIVSGKRLADPRFVAIDKLIGEDNKIGSEGFLHNIIKNPRKFDMGLREVDIAKSIIKKLGKDRKASKEVLKGAITPAFFGSGFDGVLEGLTNKNDEDALGGDPLTEEELEFLASALMDSFLDSTARLIDSAIKFSKVDSKVLRDYFSKAIVRLSNIPRDANQTMFPGELTSKSQVQKTASSLEQKKRLEAWRVAHVNSLMEERARGVGISNEDKNSPAYRKFVVAEQERMRVIHEERIKKASEIFARNPIEHMSPKQYNDFIYEMNVALHGSDEAARKHLVLFALNRRATTPHILQRNVIDLQRFLSGVHIDESDFGSYEDMEIFFSYYNNVANNRMHQGNAYGAGPEGPKESQIQVLQGEPGDINQIGMWDIREMDNSRERTNDLFMIQRMMDLARGYAPPASLGYDKNTESREEYFRARDERSKREIEAMELNRYLSSLHPDTEFTFGDIKITIREWRKKNHKMAGNYLERERMRTQLPAKVGERGSAKSSALVAGVASLRPSMADHDFSQRALWSMVKFKLTRDARLNKAKQALEGLRTTPQSDPNKHVNLDHRGHKNMFSSSNMPHIPESPLDLDVIGALGENLHLESDAIILKNNLTTFAANMGLNKLVEAGDWTRLHVIKQLHDRALEPSLRELRKLENGRGTLTKREAEERLMNARIKLYNGMIEVMGITSNASGDGKTFSVIDLMDKTIKWTPEDTDALNTQYPGGYGWLQLLTYLGGRGDVTRLQPLTVGITLDVGLIVTGGVGTDNLTETSVIPCRVHATEVGLFHHVILGLDSAKRTATAMLELDEFKVFRDQEGLVRDSNGFVDPLSIDSQLNPVLYAKLNALIREDTVAITKELSETYTFVLDINDLRMARKDGTPVLANEPSTSILSLQSKGSRDPFIFTNVDNAATQWAFTPDMLVQLLNSLNNRESISGIVLAIETNKGVNSVDTRLSRIATEESAIIFERIRGDADKVSKMLLLLHEAYPGTEPITYTDARFKDKKGELRKFINFQEYLRISRNSFSKPADLVTITLFTTDLKSNGIINSQNVSFPTSDMMYVTKITNYINKARMLGFNEEANRLSEYVIDAVETDGNERKNNKKGKRNKLTTNWRLKLLVLLSETSCNPLSIRNAKSYVGITKSSPAIEESLVDINILSEMVHYTSRTDHSTLVRETYVARALLERMTSIPPEINDNPDFIHKVSSICGSTDSKKTRAAIHRAVYDLNNTVIEPEITLPSFHMGANPDVFVNHEEFLNSVTDRTRASGILETLLDLVNRGIISQRVMDLKLMMIASVSRTYPDFIVDFHLEATSGDSDAPIMSASKATNSYKIGLNITAMKATSENEILYHFAEELSHIARVKYVKIDSPEWRRVVGLYSTESARGVIKEILILMNKGKSYDRLEKEIQYAMNNPDEWFAHFGAFLLLKEVLGQAEGLAQLQNTNDIVSESVSIWRRAFNHVRGLAVAVQRTFAMLYDSKEYSDFFREAEVAVGSLITKSLDSTPKEKVDNPDATFNAYANGSTVHQSEDFTNENRNRLVFLAQDYVALTTELASLNEYLDVMVVNKDDTTVIEAQIVKVKDKINDITIERKGIDKTTFMGLTVFEVETARIEILKKSEDNNGKITLDDIRDMGHSRALVVILVQNNLDMRGNRVDTPYTLSDGVRRLFGSKTESLLQGYALLGFNATELTTNSPLAVSMLLVDLLDGLAVTTKGSLTSLHARGLENSRYAFDSYAAHLSIGWVNLCEKYRNDKSKQQELFKSIVMIALNMPVDSSSFADKEDETNVRNLGDTISSMVKSLQLLGTQTGTSTNKSHELDPFPIRVARMDHFSIAEQDQAFRTISAALVKKHDKSITEEGMDSNFSTSFMFIADMLPIYLDDDIEAGNVVTEADKDFIKTIHKAILTNDEDKIKCKTAREVMLLHFVVKAFNSSNVSVSNFFGYASTSGAASVNTYATNMNGILRSVREETYRFTRANKDGVNSLNHKEAFGSSISAFNSKVFLKEYSNKLSDTTTASSLTRNRLTKLSNKSSNFGRRNFGFRNAEMRPKLESLDSFKTSDVLAFDFLGKCGISTHLFPANSVHLSPQDIFIDGDPDLVNLFDMGLDSIAKSLATGRGYDLLEKRELNEVSGIPGLFMNTSEFINLMDGELSGSSPGLHFHALDGRGRIIYEGEALKVVRSSLERFEVALKVIRRHNASDGTALGAKAGALNSILRTLVLLQWGPNIGTATFIVEGGMSLMNSVYGDTEKNPFIGIANLFHFLATYTKEQTKGWVGIIRDDVRFRFDSNWVPHHGEITHMAPSALHADSLATLDEISSVYLPSNPDSVDGTNEILNNLNWTQRYMYRKSRSFSNIGKALRIATDAAANRVMMRHIRMGPEYAPGRMERVRNLLRTEDKRGSLKTREGIVLLFKMKGITLPDNMIDTLLNEVDIRSVVFDTRNDIELFFANRGVTVDPNLLTKIEKSELLKAEEDNRSLLKTRKGIIRLFKTKKIKLTDDIINAFLNEPDIRSVILNTRADIELFFTNKGVVVAPDLLTKISESELLKRGVWVSNYLGTVSGIRELFADANVPISQETAIVFLRSGILEGKNLEVMNFILSMEKTYRGVLLSKGFIKWENRANRGGSLYQDEEGNDDPRVKEGMKFYGNLTRAELIEGCIACRNVIAFIQDGITQRSMVTKKSMDSVRSDHVTFSLLSFFKSYPAMHVAQQLLRRGSVAPGPKMFITLLVAATLDVVYGIFTAVCRGALSWEDLERKLARRSSKDLYELVGIVLRNPVFVANPLGFTCQALYSVNSIAKSPTISSVGEAAFIMDVKTLVNLGTIAFDNSYSWSKKVLKLYNGATFLAGNFLSTKTSQLLINMAYRKLLKDAGIAESNEARERLQDENRENFEGTTPRPLQSPSPTVLNQVLKPGTRVGPGSTYIETIKNQAARQEYEESDSVRKAKERLIKENSLRNKPKAVPTNEAATTPIPVPKGL